MRIFLLEAFLILGHTCVSIFYPINLYSSYWDNVDRSLNKELYPPFYKELSYKEGNSCLSKKEPSILGDFYENICVEPIESSSYFYPKVRLRWQICNFFECSTGSYVLEGQGACRVIPGYYIPRRGEFFSPRVCARLKQVGVDGGTQDSYKLCVYYDNNENRDYYLGVSRWNLDLFEKWQPISPVKKREFTKDKGNKLFSRIFGSKTQIPGYTSQDLQNRNIFLYLSYVDDSIGLSSVGPFYSVEGKEIGCVSIPNAPNMLPKQGVVDSYSSRMCMHSEEDLDNPLLNSTLEYPCEKDTISSDIINDSITNTIAVGLRTILPLCRNDKYVYSCLNIRNQGINNRFMTFSRSNNELIFNKNTKTLHNFPIGGGGSIEGKLIYGMKILDKDFVLDYYIDKFKDSDLDNIGICSEDEEDNGKICQRLWGADIEQNQDISVTYPELQSDESYFYSLEENVGYMPCKAYIVNKPYFFAQYDFVQEPSQICVLGLSRPECQNRILSPEIKIFPCDYKTKGEDYPDIERCNLSSGCDIPASVACESTYEWPKLIASIRRTYNSINSSNYIAEKKDIISSGMYDTVFYLTGNSFDFVVTDKSFRMKPFYKGNTINYSTIHGVYLDAQDYLTDSPPFDSNGNFKHDFTYYKGLEYINGKYFQGGEYMCIKPLDPEYLCSYSNKKNCVLAKLTNLGLVHNKCDDFYSEIQDFSNEYTDSVALCNSEVHTNCSQVKEIRIDNVPTGIYIKNCWVSREKQYCYNNAENSLKEPICQVSPFIEDRVFPRYVSGEIKLSQDSFFDINESFDTNTEGVRSKNPAERGLCVKMPPAPPPPEPKEPRPGGSISITPVGPGTAPVGPDTVFGGKVMK